jgi:hypothetical protein
MIGKGDEPINRWWCDPRTQSAALVEARRSGLYRIRLTTESFLDLIVELLKRQWRFKLHLAASEAHRHTLLTHNSDFTKLV